MITSNSEESCMDDSRLSSTNRRKNAALCADKVSYVFTTFLRSVLFQWGVKRTFFCPSRSCSPEKIFFPGVRTGGMHRVIDLQNDVKALEGHSLSRHLSADSFSSTAEVLPTDRIMDLELVLDVAELLVVVWVRRDLLNVKSTDPDRALIETIGAAVGGIRVELTAVAIGIITVEVTTCGRTVTAAGAANEAIGIFLTTSFFTARSGTKSGSVSSIVSATSVA
jgi:hypothetical protein